MSRSATFEAPSNIALVKYWGVRDEARMLPFNSSLSVTLEGVHTRTTVDFDPDQRRDEFRLNGESVTGLPYEAVVSFLDRVRARAGIHTKARVDSRNNFPTASGLASSASGFAALAGAASYAAGLSLPSRELADLARMGSGSAGRSMFGGFVEWHAGSLANGSDCFVRQVLPETHWPDLVDVIAIIADAPTKKVRSARAMQTSVATAPNYHDRVQSVPGRLAEIRRAIRQRDTARLFPLVMAECDDFRAVCEASVPSLDYLTSTSRSVLQAVRDLNRSAPEPVAAYTHDAGAHVHVFTLRRDRDRVLATLQRTPGVKEFLTVGAGAGARLIGVSDGEALVPAGGGLPSASGEGQSTPRARSDLGPPTRPKRTLGRTRGVPRSGM
ncbi:MAG: diphosphomevalonate decarboxylase [Thermoplasmata archaeon]